MDAENEILRRYQSHCDQRTDINEHLPTLRDLASKCGSVVEFGVRGIISTYALIAGLMTSSSPTSHRHLTCVDIERIDMTDVTRLAKDVGVDLVFIEHDSATVDIPQTDMLWIDSFHVYGHLKRELEKHHSKANKYIAMHDTEVDGIYGEAVRCGMDCEGLAKDYGYTVEEVRLGLKHAIDEFLNAHGNEWQMHKHFTNCNGLTILERKSHIES
jgi:hypothetical protein